ncbi:hypothetical protein ACH5RR_018964 [Cinchona calisaya]|uniref:F-box domain-containing protein n=1 Tax=Cinchona calisaya TaxID=153742 RepID=A0ABD2ZRL0_9GENT
MKRQKRVNDDERELPQPIIQHILSFLSMESAARLSMVSKTWYSSWATSPILKLDNKESPLSIEEFRQEFLNYTNKSLQRYRNNVHNNNADALCVEQLQLSMRYFSVSSISNSRFIKKLLDDIETAGVAIKELHFNYTSYAFQSVKDALPELSRILEVGFLTEFSVKGCRLEQKIGENQMIRCCLLRSLSLEYVYTNEDTLESLISSCPLIESMKFVCCPGLERIKAVNNSHNNSRLKNFSVIKCGKTSVVEVQAPNLESFYCFSVVPVIFKLYESCLNLKKLSLKSLSIEDSFFQDFAENFPNLEDLSVVRCFSNKRINISSNSLKSIELRVDRVEVEINAPNMVSFEYVGQKIPCFQNLLDITTTTSTVCNYDIKILNLSFANGDVDRFMQLNKMFEILLLHNKSKVSLLIDFKCNVLNTRSILKIIPIKIAREPGVELENDPTFHIYSFPSSPSFALYSTLLDIVFLICRPTSICLHSDKFSDSGFKKFFGRRLLMHSRRRSSANCSNSWENIRFWEEDLKEVKIVRANDQEEAENEEQFFRLEKIFFRLKWY